MSFRRIKLLSITTLVIFALAAHERAAPAANANPHEAQLREINGEMVGSRQEILLEGPHPRDAGAMTGRTRGNKSTTVIDCAQPPGACIEVEIVATRKFSLVGKEVSYGI